MGSIAAMATITTGAHVVDRLQREWLLEELSNASCVCKSEPCACILEAAAGESVH